MRLGKRNALTLLDVLILIILAFTICTVGIVMLKEWEAGNQRKAMKVELAALNRVYLRYLQNGGALRGAASPEQIVNQVNYIPHSERNLYTREVGPETYRLLHAPGRGFFYEPDRFAGPINIGKKGGNEGRQAALDILSSLDNVVWSPQEYRDRLVDLNSAYTRGTIQEPQMLRAGLLRNGESWTSDREMQMDLVDEALRQLELGVPWDLWEHALQSAYANAYPSRAVTEGGAGALNIMTSYVLTPDLAEGYAHIGGGWERPIFISTPENSSYRLLGNGADERQAVQYVYVQAEADRLTPAKYIGFLYSDPVLKWEGTAYYWKEKLLGHVNLQLFISYATVGALRSEVDYVALIANGKLDNNPWSGSYGRVVSNLKQRLIISNTPPALENYR